MTTDQQAAERAGRRLAVALLGALAIVLVAVPLGLLAASRVPQDGIGR